MKSYRFKREYGVKDAEGRLYKKGEIVELSEASARHFDRKNLITLVHSRSGKSSGKKKAPAKKAAKK